MIANTPYLDELPAYLACVTPDASGLRCPIAPPVPDPEQVNALVDAYNAAIARVAHQEGAIVVDLHEQGEVPVLHPDWVSADGFHPSAGGYAGVAAAFQTALAKALP